MFLKSNTTLVIANNAFVIPLHRQSRVASLFVFDHKYPGHALNSDSVVLSSGVQVPDVALNCFALHPVTLISIFKLIALRLLSSLLLQSIGSYRSRFQIIQQLQQYVLCSNLSVYITTRNVSDSECSASKFSRKLYTIFVTHSPFV